MSADHAMRYGIHSLGFIFISLIWRGGSHYEYELLLCITTFHAAVMTSRTIGVDLRSSIYQGLYSNTIAVWNDIRLSLYSGLYSCNTLVFTGSVELSSHYTIPHTVYSSSYILWSHITEITLHTLTRGTCYTLSRWYIAYNSCVNKTEMRCNTQTKRNTHWF